MRTWRSTRKLEDADAVAVSLLYTGADLLDAVSNDPDESAYVRAVVLGRVTDVVRFVVDRVAGDDDGGPTLADMLAGVVDTADTGPPN